MRRRTMTNKELEKRVEEQKNRQDRLDKLYQQMNKNLIDLCRSVDKLTDDVEKLKSENKPTIWSTEPVTLPTPHDFKVGDRVQFKSWDEMEKEFGLDSDENISLSRPRFLKCMTNLCGTYATIRKIGKAFVWLKDFTADGDTDWDYSLDMLKPATDEPKCKFKVGDKVKVAVDYDDKLNNKIGIIRQTCECDVPISYLIDFDKKLDSVWISEKCLEPYTEPRWTFTDDEKTILRNLPDEYKWIARDDFNNEINIYDTKPTKYGYHWNNEAFAKSLRLLGFNHLFQSIKWNDEEACEFRKYL